MYMYRRAYFSSYVILGLTNDPYRHTPLRLATDDKPFTVLMYTNGPGSWVSENATVRPNETDTNTGRLNTA